ncbi:hypothetical protein [Methylobacterium oxalidis]|nr:hypothetical protein [Methylobacterium oxalidis]GEP07813.1 hypothetical protein MOX02_58510 [Methylobacterium oxalidis]
MASIKKLTRVLTDEVHGEFRITLEAEGGETFRVAATEQQIADLIDELDDLLGDDADEDEVTEHKEMGDE